MDSFKIEWKLEAAPEGSRYETKRIDLLAYFESSKVDKDVHDKFGFFVRHAKCNCTLNDRYDDMDPIHSSIYCVDCEKTWHVPDIQKMPSSQIKTEFFTMLRDPMRESNILDEKSNGVVTYTYLRPATPEELKQKNQEYLDNLRKKVQT